jgi:hypothetical protein
MKSKYVVGQVRGEVGGKEMLCLVAIVFPECVVHADTGRRMFYEVLSAGFVDVYADKNSQFGIGVRCHGRSESLNKESKPERDEKLVRKALGLEY